MPVHHDRGSTLVTCLREASAIADGSNEGPLHDARSIIASSIDDILFIIIVLLFYFQIIHYRSVWLDETSYDQGALSSALTVTS